MSADSSVVQDLLGLYQSSGEASEDVLARWIGEAQAVVDGQSDFLDLNYHKLLTIPDSLGPAVGGFLRQLDLSSNKLTQLPESLCTGVGARRVRLELQHNRLQALPGSFECLLGLQLLDLQVL
jgi:Leucine-rich repeat (LRR) protein